MEYLIYVWIGILVVVMLPLVSLLRSCGIFPIKIFDRYYKDKYESYYQYYQEKCEELAKFKSDIYEKEIVQEKVRQIENLEKEISVLQAKVSVYQSTNETLVRAIEKNCK